MLAGMPRLQRRKMNLFACAASPMLRILQSRQLFPLLQNLAFYFLPLNCNSLGSAVGGLAHCCTPVGAVLDVVLQFCQLVALDAKQRAGNTGLDDAGPGQGFPIVVGDGTASRACQIGVVVGIVDAPAGANVAADGYGVAGSFECFGAGHPASLSVWVVVRIRSG